jgi:hypothetical protein
MKNRLTLSCVFLLSATLAMGCGGVAPEDTEETSGIGQTEPAGEPGPVSSGEAQEDPPVSDFSACCYVACHDGAWDSWRGPFSKVKYGNCTEYGRYYCGQHKWRFKAAKWDEC